MSKHSTAPASSAIPHSRPGVHPAAIVLLSAAWMATLGNLALWRTLQQLPEVHGGAAVVFGAGFALAIAALLSALMAPFIWRPTLKPVVSILLLATAFASHFMLAYGVVIDPTMIVNAVQTDARETADLLSLRMLWTVLLLAALPLFLLWRRPQRRLSAARQVGTLAALLAGRVGDCVGRSGGWLQASFVADAQPHAVALSGEPAQQRVCGGKAGRPAARQGSEARATADRCEPGHHLMRSKPARPCCC